MEDIKQIFGKYPNLFMDLKEYYQNFCTFEHVKDSPHLFDKHLHYNAGEVTKDGKIGFYQQGACDTFFVGLPIYDLQNNKIGNLSYVFEDGSYWWQIVGYKGMAKDIKTYWQVLKEGKIKEIETVEIEHHDNGNVMYEIPRKNGKRHGIEKWYYENGKLKWEIPCINGIKRGVEKGYYENGNVWYETPYKKDKRHGVEKEYDENGNLRHETIFENDEKHGVEKGYYENGNIEYEIPHKNGKRHGVAKWYHENGNLIKEILYENGELVTLNILGYC